MAFVLAMALQLQASDIRVQPVHPATTSQPRTVENVTRPGYDYHCTFAQSDGRQANLNVLLRGGRGYRTGRSDFPVRRTPLVADVSVNETLAELPSTTTPRMDDDALVIESRSGGAFVALLVIQPDWSSPDYRTDGNSTARLNWGPIVGKDSSRWFENGQDGACEIKEVVQEPLSEAETREFLAQ